MRSANVPRKKLVTKSRKVVEENLVTKTSAMSVTDRPLSPDLLRKMDPYWRAANCMSVDRIYLHDNPLLKRPLTLRDAKHMLLGHWGTTRGRASS